MNSKPSKYADALYLISKELDELSEYCANGFDDIEQIRYVHGELINVKYKVNKLTDYANNAIMDRQIEIDLKEGF